MSSYTSLSSTHLHSGCGLCDGWWWTDGSTHERPVCVHERAASHGRASRHSGRQALGSQPHCGPKHGHCWGAGHRWASRDQLPQGHWGQAAGSASGRPSWGPGPMASHLDTSACAPSEAHDPGCLSWETHLSAAPAEPPRHGHVRAGDLGAGATPGRSPRSGRPECPGACSPPLQGSSPAVNRALHWPGKQTCRRGSVLLSGAWRGLPLLRRPIQPGASPVRTGTSDVSQRVCHAPSTPPPPQPKAPE